MEIIGIVEIGVPQKDFVFFSYSITKITKSWDQRNNSDFAK